MIGPRTVGKYRMLPPLNDDSDAAGTVALLQAFLNYILSSDGQKLAGTVDFSALPSSLDQKAAAQVSQIATG